MSAWEVYESRSRVEKYRKRERTAKSFLFLDLLLVLLEADDGFQDGYTSVLQEVWQETPAFQESYRCALHLLWIPRRN
jgi:hypothetical protein